MYFDPRGGKTLETFFGRNEQSKIISADGPVDRLK